MTENKGKLKILSSEMGWAELAENLRASPFNKGLLIDIACPTRRTEPLKTNKSMDIWQNEKKKMRKR
jgi:hypothetical protein